MTTSIASNRRFVLARLPDGLPRDDDFALVDEPAAPLADGEVRLLTRYLSVDPYQRNWMAGGGNYGVPAAAGATVIGRAIGEVVESRASGWTRGEFAVAASGWQTAPVVAASALERIDRALGPLPAWLSVLGSTGLTAWVGMTDIGRPGPGETVVVSAAGGAVGSVAGQIARIAGARVVGVAGAADKCARVVADYRFDACVSHADPDLAGALARACPRGVDVYFDNTGGRVTDAVLGHLARGARIALCGLVAEYGASAVPGHDWRPLLAQQALVQGFSVRRNLHRSGEYRALAAGWIRSGELRHVEHVIDGFERTPALFRDLLEGRTFGKALVRVAADPVG